MGPPGTAGGPIYEVHLRGHLDRTWTTAFPDLQLEHQTDPNGTPLTILRGPITDEAELHGVLTRIRDLGIPLLLVRREASTKERTDETTDRSGDVDDRQLGHRRADGQLRRLGR